MKLLARFFKPQKKNRRDGVVDYYQQSINKVGKQQFQKMVQRGIRVPIGAL